MLAIVAVLLPPVLGRLVAAIYAFAAFWLLKGWEIHKTNEQVAAEPLSAAPLTTARPRKYAV